MSLGGLSTAPVAKDGLGDDEMAAAVACIRFSCVLLCTLVAGCSQTVRISLPLLVRRGIQTSD
jgi:hypothetical protein